MKKFSYAILLPVFISHTSLANHKGCEFYLGHSVYENLLTINAGFSGFYCDESYQIFVEVYFGNGDTMSWTATSYSSPGKYYYPHAGDYYVLIYADGVLRDSG